jgi:hypothetical protein
MILRKTPVFKYQTVKKEQSRKEAFPIGPGYLKDLEKNFNGRVLAKKNPSPLFLKEKKSCKFEKDALVKKFVPGVGVYHGVENALKKFVEKKAKNVMVYKEKLVRSTERAGKEKMWVPGPGSYNLFRF